MKKNFLVLAAVISGTITQAQRTTTAADTSLLDEAVVTANKYPNKTSLTGKVITVISREQLERSGGKDLAQVLSEQAGITVAGANSSPGKEKSPYLRGARIDHTLITIDGIPVYDPSGIGGNFDLRNLHTNLVERIEILKGSQSTLYGSDAIAGVINIITKKAGSTPLAGTGTLSYGSYGTTRASAALQGKKEKMDYSASLALHDTKGINETEERGASVTDKDGFNQLSFQAGLGFRPAANLSIQPFFRYTRIKGDIDQGAFTDELDYTYRQKSWQAGIRTEWNLGTTKINLLYSYNRVDRVYTDDSVKSRNGFDTWSQGAYSGGEHFADLFGSTAIGKQVILTTGIDFRHALSDQQFQSVGSWGPYKTDYNRDSLRQDQLGVYTSLNWQHPSGFNAEAGGRVNMHSEYGGYVVFNLNPSYLINRQVKVFANLSSGYRTPSLYQLFSEYGNRDLEPEAALTAEGGLQVYSRNNTFTGRAVVFSRRVNDVIFFYFNPVTFASRYINQDRQRDHGLELETTIGLSKKITLKTFYTYITGKIETQQGGKDTSYNNLLRRPRHAAGINLAAAVSNRFFVSSNLQYAGERKDAYFDNMLFTTVHTRLSAYALWDLYMEYGLCDNKLKFFADLRNISNSRYTEISGFRTLGFNGSGGIRYQF